MWHQTAKWLSRFPELVVTAMSANGYPVSVRHQSLRYDARTGELPFAISEHLAMVVGPANVLAHYHDEKLWHLRAMQIRGRVERRGSDWVFISAAVTPPPRGQIRTLWRLASTLRRSADRYLAKRGLTRPDVNWAAVDILQQQARLSRDRRNALRSR
jgi:hypothetical protein